MRAWAGAARRPPALPGKPRRAAARRAGGRAGAPEGTDEPSVYRTMKRQLRSALEEQAAKEKLVESVDEYVENEKKRLMGLAGKAYAELDELSRMSKSIASLEFDLALSELNEQTSALASSLERTLESATSTSVNEEELQAYEERLAARRQRGLFFKSLYTAPPRPKAEHAEHADDGYLEARPQHWRIRLPSELEEAEHASDMDALHAAFLAQQQSFDAFKRALYGSVTAILLLGMGLAMSEGLESAWPRFSLYAGLFGTVVVQTVLDLISNPTDPTN